MTNENEVRDDGTGEGRNFGVRGLNPETIARIEEARKPIGSRRDLALRAGIPLSTLNEALKGEREPRFNVMVAIARALGRTVDWLVTGDEMSGLPTVSVSASDFVLVPVLPQAVSAGNAAVAEDNDLDVEKHVAFRGDWMRRIGVNPKRGHVLRVRGDSMEPTLSEGDVILVDTGDADPAGGGMFVIATADGAQVKRLLRRMDGSLMIISDNRDIYPPEVLAPADADAFRIIGRVRWYARTIR